MNKYEKLIEYIINDDDAKARALFHEIVVEKSRDIYESLMDEEQYDEGMGGNQVNGMMDEIQADESGMAEDEEMDMDMGMEPIDGDDSIPGEEGQGDIEDRVMDLETELDALKAEFEQLMGDEAGEEEHNDGENDPDFSEVGDEESSEDEVEAEGMYESAEEEEEEEEEEESMEESRNYRKSDIELMREYVEKVTAPANSEGSEVGKGGSVAVNKTSITDNMKNDMGGTTANIAKGGAESDPSGTPANKTKLCSSCAWIATRQR